MVAGGSDAVTTQQSTGRGGGDDGKLNVKFVPFTHLSLEVIANRRRLNAAQQTTTQLSDCDKAGAKTANDTRKDKPNTAFVAGKPFPEKFGSFPPELYGKPIEDLDEYYRNKYVSPNLHRVTTPKQ